jgi:endo-1,4-beta-xylanase
LFSSAWMFADENKQPLSRAKALENLKAHIETVVKHFHGKVHGWDVVNEAIADEGDRYLRDTPARKAIGDDYVIKAFEFARAASPNVQLYYNDYNIEQPYKRAKGLKLIKELKAAGVKLDGVGIQGHWLIDSPSAKEIDEAISAYGALGVKVMITELDVDALPRKGAGADISATEKEGLDPYKNGLPDDVQKKLAKRYGELFKVLAKHRDSGVLTRVTFWGFYDGSTWLDNWPVRGRTNHPFLWDRELRPKPALDAVIAALRQ